MKRIFTIGEKVWTPVVGDNGKWGVISHINRTTDYKWYPLCDEQEDIIGIKTDDGEECEVSPSECYQFIPNRTFRGHAVVLEHSVELDYPLYCPEEDENCYVFETDEVIN